MPDQQFAQYQQHKLAGALTNAGLLATWDSVAGWPVVGDFSIRIDDPAPATTFEIVRATAVNVGAAQTTIVRAQEGTTGIAHAIGAFGGNELTAAMIAAGARGILSGGYAPVSANQAGIVANVDLAGLAATVTVPVGRRIKVTGTVMALSTVADDICGLFVQEGAAVLQSGQQVLRVVGQAQSVPPVVAILQPSAGAHTYKLTMSRAAGTGSLTMAAAAAYIASILVEDIGSQ